MTRHFHREALSRLPVAPFQCSTNCHPLPLLPAVRVGGRAGTVRPGWFPHPLWSGQFHLSGSQTPQGKKGLLKWSDRSWHMSDTGRAQQGAAPIQMGLQGFSPALTETPRVVLDQGIDSGDSRPQGIPPATLPLRPTPTQPAGKRGHSRRASMFLHPVYTQLYTIYRNLIYRYIYRISYINVSFLQQY